jgi:hypothetical protein
MMENGGQTKPLDTLASKESEPHCLIEVKYQNLSQGAGNWRIIEK